MTFASFYATILPPDLTIMPRSLAPLITSGLASGCAAWERTPHEARWSFDDRRVGVGEVGNL
ncbi:MAG: hypothetical protein EBE86_031695 [Hormoscilla sp. GUM202]|nr:hypothetical protein [Hormoscilla sp. GUM202]